MREATVPILACTKNTAGDAYLRIGIGVLFDTQSELWDGAVKHTGFPGRARGFSANIDITLA
jgi:hypothetical protein